MNSNQDRVQCVRCKVSLPHTSFKKKRNEDLYKRCVQCTDRAAEYRNTHKCPHGRQKCRCKECQGCGICMHQKRKSRCKDCKGNELCEHQKMRSFCKVCQGIGICDHQRRISHCKECQGGAICMHQKIRSRCKDCKGCEVCIHQRRRSICKECNPNGHLADIVRLRVYRALKKQKSQGSIEYLGTNIIHFREHIQDQFKDGMSWENYGKEWHIDHIIPLDYETPTLEEVIERLYYTNCQPLWAFDNISKGNRCIG